MTAPAGKGYGVGARMARAYVLDSNGWPLATSPTVPYEGGQIYALKNFNLASPDARRISHFGDDRVLANDFLPPTEGGSGTMASARMDFAELAAMTGTKVATIGEGKVVGYGTSQRGYEPDLAVLAVQQWLDADTRVRRWRGLLAPMARAMIKPASMNENSSEYTLNMLLNVASKYPWGVAFAIGTEGYTDAEILELEGVYFPHIVSWKADNIVTKFLFDAARPAQAVGKIHLVTINGVADATVTKAVDGVTPTAKPASLDIVTCWYEYAV